MLAWMMTATAGGNDLWADVMRAGPMGKFVLLVLLVFSVASWGIIAERWRTFRKAERETSEFLKRFHEGGGLAAIQDSTKDLEWSPVADIYRAGFREISLNPPPQGQALVWHRRQRPLWLVDDILTTGSTALAAAEALHCAGWAVQGVLALARTPS